MMEAVEYMNNGRANGYVFAFTESTVGSTPSMSSTLNRSLFSE